MLKTYRILEFNYKLNPSTLT